MDEDLRKVLATLSGFIRRRNIVRDFLPLGSTRFLARNIVQNAQG